MNFVLQPWQFFVVLLVGWVHREQKKIIESGAEVGQTRGEIECRERLGGLLRYYHRKAA